MSATGVREIAARLSLSTPWPRASRATVSFWIVIAVGLLFLLLPRAVGWRGDHLHSEDGQVFLTEFLAHGLASLTDTYAGYLHVVPRSLTALCASTIGPDGYAACVAVTSNLTRAAVMVVAFPVLAAYARSWRWGLLAAAAGILFLPAGQQEVLSNFTNLRWFLLAGAFFALIGVFRTRWLLVYASVVALLAALSDPMPLLLAPLALWRLWKAPGWSRLPSAALLVGGAVHLLNLDASARGERGGFLELLEAPSQTVGQLLVRGPLTTQWGVTISQDLAQRWGFPLALLTLVISLLLLLVLAWRGRQDQDPAVPFTVLLVGLGVGFLLVTLSFPASYIALADFWSPSQPARYSALTGLFLTPALVLAMSRAWSSRRDPLLGRAWVLISGVVLLVAVVGDFGGDARSTDGATWTENLEVARVQCQEGASTVSVPNSAEFEGWRTTLTCDWINIR